MSKCQTDYLDADLRDTGRILSDARDDNPYGIVKRLMAAVPSGSYLVVGHPASDVEAEASATATSGLNNRLAAPVKFRSRDEVAGFLDGLSTLEPGLVQYPQWRPGPGVVTTRPASAWCAVARKE